jgi:hypothetical protein
MKRRSRVIGCLLSAVLAGVGCSKSGETAGAATTTAAETASAGKSSITAAPVAASTPAASAPGARDAVTANVSAANANTAASTGAPAGLSTAAAVPASIPNAAGGPAAGAGTAAADVASPETIRKKAEIEWALKQDEIKNDPNGQWAAQAKASSTYNDAKGNAPYSANQATGPANIENFGNSSSAWTAKTPDAGIEWLELQYAKPVYATVVRVRETYGSGAIIKIELFDEKGAPHTVWTGADSTKDLNYLVAEFPKTAFKTGRVKVTLATNIVRGANEIDAVQLVGTDQ